VLLICHYFNLIYFDVSSGTRPTFLDPTPPVTHRHSMSDPPWCMTSFKDDHSPSIPQVINQFAVWLEMGICGLKVSGNNPTNLKVFSCQSGTSCKPCFCIKFLHNILKIINCQWMQKFPFSRFLGAHQDDCLYSKTMFLIWNVYFRSKPSD
jgi:hypothetical protein